MYKLMYMVIEQDVHPVFQEFKTKKEAQLFDRMMKEAHGDTLVLSRIIYSEE